MKLIIDIPEETYNDIQSRDWKNGEFIFSEEWRAIHNGTPLDDIRDEIDYILRDLGINCAYDMPSFWANNGKDYKIIPTRWHKGYQQAVADFNNRIEELFDKYTKGEGE